jgi:hypothetical protein
MILRYATTHTQEHERKYTHSSSAGDIAETISGVEYGKVSSPEQQRVEMEQLMRV